MAMFADFTLFTAFSSGLDGSNRNAMPTFHPTSDSHNSEPATIPTGNLDSHDWASIGYQPPGPTTLSNGLTGVEDSNTDVYWFWNTVWNDYCEEL